MTEKLELNELIKLQEKSSFCHHTAVYMEGDLSFFSPFWNVMSYNCHWSPSVPPSTGLCRDKYKFRIEKLSWVPWNNVQKWCRVQVGGSMILSLPSGSRVQFEIFQPTFSKVFHSLLEAAAENLKCSAPLQWHWSWVCGLNCLKEMSKSWVEHRPTC